MPLHRLAILSVHTSPLAPMGGKKTGGMNVYIREFAQEAARRGIQVDIFTRRSDVNEPKIDAGLGENIRVIYLEAGPVAPLPPDEIFPYLSEFTSRLMAFAMLQADHYDFVYSHYWLSGWVAQKLKESWGTPFVQMFHTLGQMKQRILSHETTLPDQRIQTETEVMQWADKLVAATPAEYMQMLWLYRADRRKIEIIPPGVNIERFHPVDEATNQQHIGPVGKNPYLLFVGRIERLKAVDSILHALAILQNNDPHLLDDLRFLVVGGDPQDATDTEMMTLQQLALSLGVADRVCFVGARDQHQLPTIYANALAALMPSDYESFGMAALEAMASGTPVIASRVGGLAYLVRDGETGYLVPVREPQAIAASIADLLSDTQKRKEMGRRAAEVAQEYAWGRIVDRLLTIFAGIQARQTART
ncbi:MAG: glycosyltransferase [Anaerolineae bacterium]|nr:glycosyltransferase [Anaerolineae bacterium]